MNIFADNFNTNTQPITTLPNPPRTLRAISFSGFFLFSLALLILTFVVFGALRILQIPVGQLIDWVFGLISFWWLLVIVTVPWNISFQAKETLVEATASRERGIFLNESHIDYVRRVARRSLIAAIALHILSALVLFMLAVKGISPVGYVSSAAALLLTALRPGIRGYEYLWARLSVIRGQILYPREDVIELRQRFNKVENQVKYLMESLDENRHNSWANKKASAIRTLDDKLFNLKISLEAMNEQNEKDHQRISRETQSAVAQLTSDSQFLEQVREIIRFFKTA